MLLIVFFFHIRLLHICDEPKLAAQHSSTIKLNIVFSVLVAPQKHVKKLILLPAGHFILVARKNWNEQ